MALIALVTADKVSVGDLSTVQIEGVAGEDITAGAPCIIDNTSGGKFLNSNAASSPRNTTPTGIATHTAKSGQALTLIRRGPMDGFDLSGVNYGATLFASDTVGRIGDVAGTANLKIGFCLPVFGAPLGTAADKILMVELTTGV